MSIVHVIAGLLSSGGAAPTSPVPNNWQSTSSETDATSYTLPSYVVGAGSNKMLVVIAGSEDRFGTVGATVATGVTWNSQSLTKIVDANTVQESSFEVGVSIWALLAPAEATSNIVATWSEAQAAGFVAAVWLTGAAQTLTILNNILETITNQAGASTTINSVLDNSLMIDGLQEDDGGGTSIVTTQSGQTIRANMAQTFKHMVASERTIVTGGNLSMGWTFDPSYARAAHAVIAVAGA